MLTTTFTTLMLALGIGVLVVAVIMIVGFVISTFIGAGVATVDSARHHGHVDEHLHEV